MNVSSICIWLRLGIEGIVKPLSDVFTMQNESLTSTSFETRNRFHFLDSRQEHAVTSLRDVKTPTIFPTAALYSQLTMQRARAAFRTFAGDCASRRKSDRASARIRMFYEQCCQRRGFPAQHSGCQCCLTGGTPVLRWRFFSSGLKSR